MRTTKNKPVNQILDFKRTKFDKVKEVRLCNQYKGLDSARNDTWKFYKVLKQLYISLCNFFFWSLHLQG